MNFKRLADVIRRFEEIDFLASEIETLTSNRDVETVDDLTEFLEDELNYAN